MLYNYITKMVFHMYLLNCFSVGLGLSLLIDGTEESHQTFGTPQQEIREWDRKTYFGRSLSDMVRERYADATLERLDVWNVQKDYLQIHGLVGSNSTSGYTVPGQRNVTSGGSEQSFQVNRVNITTINEQVTIRPGVEVVPDVFARVINDDRRIQEIPGAETTIIEPGGDTHIIRPPVVDTGVDIIVLNGTVRRENQRRTTPPPRKLLHQVNAKQDHECLTWSAKFHYEDYRNAMNVIIIFNVSLYDDGSSNGGNCTLVFSTMVW